MNKKLRITIIAPFSFGYVEALVDELYGYTSVDVCFIQLDKIKFTYTGFPQRIKNFFSKTFLRTDLKIEHQDEEIRKRILNEPPSDCTLVIRPDKLKKETLVFLKGYTGELNSYYFDAIENIPKMKARIPFFDKVFSYEKIDVEKYGLEFITNYIPVDYCSSQKANGVFNISSYDERFPLLEAVAKKLHEQKHPYKIIVRQGKKGSESKYIQTTRSYLPLSETKRLIEEAGILLDIQKHDQKGLSFRVFEALGSGKKLITTNLAITEYDFYNPNNILVINENNPIIPKKFLDGPYAEVPESVLFKYRREAWIKQVFGVEKN